MDPYSEFEEYRIVSSRQIDAELDVIVGDLIHHATAVSPLLFSSVEALGRAFRGGKHIRGTLVKLGYELLHGIDSSKVTLAATAIEILQTAFLVHDDIIDKSEMRRDIPALHIAAGVGHKGISYGICLGDLALGYAYDLLLSSNFPVDRIKDAVAYLTRSVIRTNYGQLLDITLTGLQNLSMPVVLNLYRYKTGYYTVTDPLCIGGAFAGMSPIHEALFEKLGLCLGTAYQIVDDVRDIYANGGNHEGGLADIHEGKATLLYLYAVINANLSEKAVLAHYYGNPNTDEKDADLVRKVFTQTGAQKYAMDQYWALSSEARKIVEDIPADLKYKKILIGFIDYLDRLAW